MCCCGFNCDRCTCWHACSWRTLARKSNFPSLAFTWMVISVCCLLSAVCCLLSVVCCLLILLLVSNAQVANSYGSDFIGNINTVDSFSTAEVATRGAEFWISATEFFKKPGSKFKPEYNHPGSNIASFGNISIESKTLIEIKEVKKMR